MYRKSVKFGDHATNLPATVRFASNGVFRESMQYRYDSMGNIVEISENGRMVCRYEYDALCRLTREDNVPFNKTTTWAYDNNGNILAKYEYALTAKPTEELPLLNAVCKLYTYADNSDQLVSCNGEIFAYDIIGNPTTYRDKTATWANGRQLTAYDGNTFAYDARGRRTAKNSISFIYDSNGNLLKQSNGLEFLYDHTGVFATKYNNATYYYRKDAQGNIIALLDNTGAVVVKYKYDTWGKCLTSVLDPNASAIAELNPFRYRGYYFDTETGLYFLKTRYYDPEIGRFITIDDISYLDRETINGLNLYAYCGNNPVMGYDPNGTFVITTALIIGAIIGAVVGGVVGGAYAYNKAAGSGATGWELFGKTALGVLGGAVIGGALGAAVGGLIGTIAPYVGGFLTSSFTFPLPALVAETVGVGAVTVSGAQIVLAGGIVISAIIGMHGEPNSTVKQGGSTGKYDENGNLISRQDTTGKPHFIKEYGDYFLPHTHVYKWRLIDGVWRIVQKIILPW